ncbi:hypothetical protein ABT297_20160 [Dactylosporangium sp. NPDC000555]|uniref:hypothetical protein n=1 Tax=Dactylosporangium sp. NPDC000555 TaxID=3154260 RepID=UPI00331DECC8
MIDLDRYSEIDPDDLPGPAPLRRRPGVRVLVLAALALLAAAPAAPPRTITLARATPHPQFCRSEAAVRLHVVLGDRTQLSDSTMVFKGWTCGPHGIEALVRGTGP